MATAAKSAGDKSVPASRSASENPDEEGVVKSKGKKKIIYIIIGAIILIVGGGGGWYFSTSSQHADVANEASDAPLLTGPAKFIPLEPFTVNLQREDSDRFLQIGITLKIFDPHLDKRINVVMPEIRSRLLVLLSGKYPSELYSTDGKRKLVQKIINEVDSVLGLNTQQDSAETADVEDTADAEDTVPNDTEPSIASKVIASGVIASDDAITDETATDTAEPDGADQAETEGAPAKEPDVEKTTGIVDVLFTSFIIQ